MLKRLLPEQQLNKYEDAVNKYNDAISGGNADEIADAKQYYDDINKSVQVLMNTDASKYSSQFKEIGDQLNTAAIKANEFNQALSGEGENGFQKHLQSVAEEIKKLNMDDADFKAAVSSGDVDSINYLVQAAEQAGIISGTSASEIQPLITALGNLGYISNMSADGLNNVADSASNVEMSFSDLAKEDSSNLLQEISSVQEALDSQSIGISVSYDDFSSDALADYRDCLEYVNGSLVLNEENVKKLTNAKVEEQVATNNTAKAQKQQEYLENAKQIEALRQKLLDNTDATGKSAESIQEQIDGLLACNDAIVEQCSQSQIGVYYEEQFKRAAEKVDRFRDKLDGLKSLISDDMKIDKNTGLLTESGALSITLDVDDINASTENLKTYIKERQQIINDYNAGKFGEDEYNQKLKDVDANIKSTTANIYSSRNSILELVKSQSQAELDVLNKVIDKRKEALSAKKSYYDYDKTLKNKTKDIEVLERQIAALEGSTSAEDKARKAKLQEQLDSAKEDLNDTITDHAYSMQTDALDKLSADMSEDLDKWINTISSNMEEMTTAINDAVKNAGLSTAGTINAISSILRHYRLSDSEISQSGLTNITGYASGTNYVNKSGIYRVNEKGMESVFSKQYGTLTFLNQGDKVFDANFTKQLLDNSTIATQKNMPDYAGMAKAIEKNIQNIQNLSGNTYVNNFYIDGAQDTESILREIDKHLDKKIQAHDKKQVRDFKSLR